MNARITVFLPSGEFNESFQIKISGEIKGFESQKIIDLIEILHPEIKPFNYVFKIIEGNCFYTHLKINCT